ncbi:MAG: hypothetical protein H6Q89_4759 [Myxococcaceae bacterium]|nr:hypothetical protein [Myxococcaceae bacterium]
MGGERGKERNLTRDFKHSARNRAPANAAAAKRTAPFAAGGWLLVLLAPAAAVAQPLTVEQVLAEARANRQELKASRARAEAVAQTPKIVGALSDPMLMGGVDHLPFKLNGVNYSVQLQQDFPLSRVRGARARTASRQADAARAQIAITALDVEANALRSFLLLVEAQRMKAVTTELRALAAQVQSSVQARVAATQASLSEAVRAEVEVARLDGELLAYEREVLGAWAMTQAAMGRTSPSAEVPQSELTTPTRSPSEVSALVDAAIERRPELAQMRASAEAARANVEVMSSMYFPMAFVRIGAANTMMEGPGLMLMAGVSLPIFRERLGAGYEEASAMSRMAEADVEAMRTMIQGQVGAARERVLSAQARFAAARDRLLPLSQQAVKLAMVAYTSGQLPLVSVLDAARAQGEAQLDAVRAELELDAAWIELGRATGEVNVGS